MRCTQVVIRTDPGGWITTSSTQFVTGTSQLAANTWVHLAATYDGATLRLYVNGAQVGSRAVTQSMALSAGPLQIGGNAVWGEYFSGLIDDVRVYNRALTSAEITNGMTTAVGAMTAFRCVGLVLGCVAAFADDPAGAPTYFGEVGRILADKCIACHRAGQPGRFPLDTWEQARLFAREIRLVVGMRKMPPWPAVPAYGRFSNDRSLSVAEIETLIRWTDTGTLKGNGDGRLTMSYRKGDANEPSIDLMPPFSMRSRQTAMWKRDAFLIKAYEQMPGFEESMWFQEMLASFCTSEFSKIPTVWRSGWIAPTQPRGFGAVVIRRAT